MSGKPAPGRRVELWMLVDREPGYENFEIGDRITPTTEWITADAIAGGVPDSLITTVAGEVELDPASEKYGWMHLGRQFSASLRTWPADPGPTMAEGLLLYDRYLWIDGPSRAGEAVVLERANLACPVTLRSTRYENVFAPEYHGRNIVNRESTAPEGTSIEWLCIRIGIDPLD